MDPITRLQNDYPWTSSPVVIGAPMRLIALGELAVEISRADGIGFLAAGTDLTDLSTHLQHAQTLLSATPPLPTRAQTLPLGIGFINWGASLPTALPLIATYRPAAVWFFAPATPASLVEWTTQTRAASPSTRIWVQVGSVADAVAVVRDVEVDVLVVQGADAGGHGLVAGAGVGSLVPEVVDAVGGVVGKGEGPVIVAAGGIMEARGAAGALCLGAAGVVMGTRFLGAREAKVAEGYREEVLRARDGGQTTVRTKVYDVLRGTTGWAESYNARGVVNRSFVDAEGGMAVEENKRLYEEEVKKGDAGWGVEGRMTTYAGTGVGLVTKVQDAGEIVREVREGAKKVLRETRARWA